ncbi:MAG: hypothetical protein H6Q74_343 [Firmicutes bacterium]|nr:hypothetical protein [Bacillota bacterium]
MSTDACIKSVSGAEIVRSNNKLNPEKIVIVIENGNVVWFDTNGKFPPNDECAQGSRV